MASVEDHYELADRYRRTEGTVFLTGVQALARLPIDQLRADRAAGLSTAALVSGYPGSPLGGFDSAVAGAARMFPELHIECRPALNEEYGATAVMGSQLAAEQPDCRYQGVVGYWYGKAPGLDRASDALRHAVFAGTSRHGGAVALVGDDPLSKSSSLPSSSDATLGDLHMPILYPGDVQQVLDLGHHAVALSRVSGLWTAMKIVTAVADGSGTVEPAFDRLTTVIPDLEVDGRLHETHPRAWFIPPYTLDNEQELREVRLKIAQRYSVANRLNRITDNPSDAWIGLVASGYTFGELREALRRLGLARPEDLDRAGIRLLEVRMPTPFDTAVVREFARGLDEIMVVEEKNPTLEWLVKDSLYSLPDRPLVVGKTAPDGTRLVPSTGMVDADTILGPLRSRLEGRLGDRLAPLPTPAPARRRIPLAVNRTPYFCSGCPHNWGTRVPEGSLVGSGIGCHGLNLFRDPAEVGEILGLAAMGNEGVQWIGMSPFVEREHYIQNLGDGTYFHSGQLAIQAAVAAGVNVTYKLLYNGTVAMTGGQDAQGSLEVPALVRILLLQGVARVLVTTDDRSRYKGVDLPGGVEVWDRSRIVEAQELLATVPGVTVLIHDQACAAEKRRARRRGRLPTPSERVVINPRVCEACGDCGKVSNCLSVQTEETPFGVKTHIDQSSCNLDYSCLLGDCPSFMTVTVEPEGAGRGTGAPPDEPVGDLPEPGRIVPTDEMGMRLIGIGGTGVVTVAQILATAAMLDGFEVRGMDQTGLSQKAGPVVSDIRFSRGGAETSNHLGSGQADLILAFDLLTAVSDSNLRTTSHERTVVVGSTTEVPPGSLVGHPERHYPDTAELEAVLEERSRREFDHWLDAAELTRGLLGDAAPANVLLLGVAYQSGAVPMSAARIEEAIELNGVAVELNLRAFRWGRLWAVDRDQVVAAAAAGGTRDVAPPGLGDLPPSLRDAVIALGLGSEVTDRIGIFTADLIGYQSEELAAQYLEFVARTERVEATVDESGERPLTETVARNLHRLTAYKDEYEVARLLLGPETAAAAAAVGGPGARVSWRLHPPLLKALGMKDKISVPARLGRPAMSALARGRRLRGTRWDPFGRTPLRRMERELPAEYRAAVDVLLEALTPANHTEAVRIADLPDQVRGFEELKASRISAYRDELSRSLARIRS